MVTRCLFTSAQLRFKCISVLKICFTLALALTVQFSIAQTCTGTLGDPVLDQTFGAGSANPGPQLPINTTSNIVYVNSTCPSDGFYSIVNYTSGCFGDWSTLRDHTGDPNGYFMLVNANLLPSDFFIDTVKNLCEGTTYQFGSYISNMCTILQIFPNIIFTIEKPDGTILSSYKTGDIPTGTNPPTWIPYSFFFTIPQGNSSVVLRMHNNAPGGNGNDFGLDDITFKPVGPPISVSIAGQPGLTKTVCDNDPSNITLQSMVGSCYTSTAYQWQISTDSLIWTNIQGATGITYSRVPTIPGKYFYRLLVAEQGNIGNVNCGIHSLPITIIVKPTPVINVTSTNPTCSQINGSFTVTGLNATESYIINYNKDGLSQPPYSSAANSSGSINITSLLVGSYTAITATSSAGCVSNPKSITLTTRNDTSITTQSPSICSNMIPYIWNGKSYYKSANDSIMLHNTLGCDSLVRLRLTVSDTSFSNKYDTICANLLPYIWNGKTYNSTSSDAVLFQNAAGCDSLARLFLIVLPASTPSVIVTADLINICQGQKVNFTATSSSTGALPPLYQWSVNGTNILGAIKNTYSTDSLAIGKNIISNVVSVQGPGCFYNRSATNSVVVMVYPIPTINLMAQDSIINYGSSTQIIATVTPSNNINYEWSSSSNDIASTTTLSPLIVSPIKATTYTLQVSDQSNSSCQSSQSILITVYTNFVMPNAFTPGNTINNIFRIPPGVIFGLKDFSIYNRWGNKVFETTNLNEGWDGNYGTVPCSTDTYVYVITGNDLSGSVVHKGTVVLIR